MIKENSFSKKERICSRGDINELFEKGDVFFTYPFKCVYSILDSTDDLLSENIYLRTMISVGKRYNKRAVKRNRVKRLIREAYRLNKKYTIPNISNIIGARIVNICYIYTGKKEENFNTIENGIKKSFIKMEDICKARFDINTSASN